MPRRVRAWAAEQGGHATLFARRRQGRPACSIRCPTPVLAPAPAAEGGVRPARHPQPRPPVRRVLMQTDLRPRSSGHARRARSRRDPARVRPLRLLHGDVPDLPAAGRRARRPARAHLPDQAGARRRRGDREDAAAPRPLPHLPQLRDDLPVGRPVRAAGRHRAPRRRRAQVGRTRDRARAALRVCARAAARRRCSARRWRSGRIAQPLLPAGLARKRPRRSPPPARGRAPRHARKMLIAATAACSRRSRRTIDAAMARVLDRIGISPCAVAGGGCCGALPHHLTSRTRRARSSRRNIDAWWPHVERGAEAIVVTASGCGVMVKDYGHLLRARRRLRREGRSASPSSRATRSRSSRPNGRRSRRKVAMDQGAQRVAFHSPCTLQHGMQLRGRVEEILLAIGHELAAGAGRAPVLRLRRHVLDPAAGAVRQLKANKLAALEAERPDVIATANIGCHDAPRDRHARRCGTGSSCSTRGC